MSVIIYHDNCPDGFGSAWWLGKHIGKHDPYGAAHNTPPPLDLSRGRDVWLVDFCYPAGPLTELTAVARTVTILDHHQSTVGYLADAGIEVRSNVADFVDLAQLGGANRVDGVLDQSRSGVGLVAAYVRRQWGVEPPAFLAHIEDRDLWRFDLPGTAEVFAAVTSRPYTVQAWDAIAAARLLDLVAEGEAIARYRDRLVEQVGESTFPLHVGGMEVPCASSPYAIGSDVAGALAARNPDGIGAYAIWHADHIQIGLRSTSDGPDVAAIAEGFGGGGHTHAAGMRLPWPGRLTKEDTDA